ncbi:MAG: HD family phosphohydrolase [Thermodesulfobacteriota bacterium]
MNLKLTDISLKKHSTAPWVAVGILLTVTLLSTLIFYPKLVVIDTPYQVGDIADENIKAPQDFFIEDAAATREKRDQARQSVLTVYDYDRSLLPELKQRVNKAFSIARGPSASAKAAPPPARPIPAETPPGPEDSRSQRIRKLKPAFEDALGLRLSEGAYKVLEKHDFSPDIPKLINKLLDRILTNGVVSNKEMLLKEQENDRGIALRTVGTNEEQVVDNLKHFHGMDQAKTMVRIEADPLLKGMDYNLVNLIVDVTQRLLHPNITLNRSATERRKIAAESEIKPILYQIKKGEMILREGERISELDMLKLRSMRQQTGKSRLLTRGIGTALIIFCLLAVTYLIHLKNRSEIQLAPNKHLAFIGTLLVAFFLMAQLSVTLAESIGEGIPFAIRTESMFYGIPLAAGAMTVCQFAGFSIAFPFAIVTALIAAILFENSYVYCLYFLLNGIMGAFWTQNCKNRKDYIVVGAKIGLLNIALATMVDIYVSEIALSKLPWDWTFAFMGGISAGIVTIGVSPLVEMGFGYTTDNTLLELSNLDQPLMRRLMLEAPGTYHHCVIVGSMVEAAASEVGANPMMAKVCGYYHDIGKLKNPMHFIENQKNGKNIHNKLAPSMSCLILISHIKNGVELARQYKLGQEIIDAIKQHHGTSLLSYFYDKAKKQKKDQPINTDNFRYPGPKPQTRETALIMLADQVEAASRTLEHPTPSRIQGLVQQLINKIFSDNQLDECPLTLKDLHKIARTYIKILNGIYHHRVEYPEKTPAGAFREKNGHTDHKPSDAVQNIDGSHAENGPSTLKRLGQA